jgi:hypothetical protein
MKLMESDGVGAGPEEALRTAILETLGEEALRYVRSL